MMLIPNQPQTLTCDTFVNKICGMRLQIMFCPVTSNANPVSRIQFSDSLPTPPPSEIASIAALFERKIFAIVEDVLQQLKHKNPKGKRVRALHTITYLSQQLCTFSVRFPGQIH